MTWERIPRWSFWALAVSLFWLGWGLAVARTLIHATAELTGQLRETEAEIISTQARIGAIPELVARHDLCAARLDSVLSGFFARDDCDRLIRHLREEAQMQGLGEVVIDPDLPSLLEAPASPAVHGCTHSRLDTIVVVIAARGRFGGIGRWLDVIEERSDFRYWISCAWSAAGDSGEVALDARVALVVVNPAGSIDSDTETDVSG